MISYLVFSESIQSLSHVQLLVTPWTAVCQASLFVNSGSLLKHESESVMPSNRLIVRHPLLLLPLIFPSIRVFSNESVLHIRWPKCWKISFFFFFYSQYLCSFFFFYSSNFILFLNFT